MRKISQQDRADVLTWCETLDQGALEQANHLAQLPFLVGHIALMPDAHVGYGMPIGGVVGLSGVVIPNAVGVDIGCGMRSVETSLRPEKLPLEKLKVVGA